MAWLELVGAGGYMLEEVEVPGQAGGKAEARYPRKVVGQAKGCRQPWGRHLLGNPRR